MNPTPPSSYMLRELKDVPIPDTVSWWPQTLGWQLLLLLVVLLAFFFIYKKAKFWWHNRYRREALDALLRLSPNDALWPRKMFKIVKAVMVYIDPKNAAIYGQPLLNQMDRYRQGGSNIAKNAHFTQWVVWLENPQSPTPDFAVLRKEINAWLTHHQLPEKAE